MDDNTKYAHSIWSHGDNYSLRTINNLESWHRRLNDNVNGSHPNIFKIIEIFQKQQAQNEIQVESLILGNNPRKTKAKCSKLHKKLIKIREKFYQDFDISTFLNAAIHCI